MEDQNQNKSSNEENQKEPVVNKEHNEAPVDGEKDIFDNKIVAALSYIGLLCLIPLLTKKDSKFAYFHAKQGLVLLIGEVVGTMLIPVLGLGLIVHFAAAILSIIGLVNVFSGKAKKLPIVGDLAEKINI